MEHQNFKNLGLLNIDLALSKKQALAAPQSKFKFVAFQRQNADLAIHSENWSLPTFGKVPYSVPIN